MPAESGLFGIVDALTGATYLRVNAEGTLTNRLIGSDGATQAVVTTNIVNPGDAGVVIKSADLADIKALLVEILLELKAARQ